MSPSSGICTNPLQVLLYSADDYIKGYIEGILQAQLRVYGYYFINELITNDLLDAINQSFRKIGQTTLVEPQRTVFCYCIRNHEFGTQLSIGTNGRII